MQQAQLRLISGKGGVGKTVVATSLAQAAAAAGQRVLLCELNGRDRVAPLLQVAPVGPEIQQVFDNLWVVDINPRAALHEYVLLVMKVEALYQAIFENRVVRSFINLVPSLGEMVMLGKIWYHAQQQVNGRRRFDLIVVDAPATGHALALLEAPQVVHDSVPPGPMRDNAARMRDMLRDPAQTRLHLVTTAEDMPVTESLQMLSAAAAMQLHCGAVLINAQLPPLPTRSLAAVQAAVADSAAAQPFMAALHWQARRQQAGTAQLARLGQARLQQAVVLPHVPPAEFLRCAVDRLAAVLQQPLQQGAL